MNTAGDYRAEAARLRALAREATDADILTKLREMIAELEARARELENGA